MPMTPKEMVKLLKKNGFIKAEEGGFWITLVLQEALLQKIPH